MSCRVTRIELDGLKGVRAAHDLPGPVILAGPNGCGKSAVLEAVRLALGGAVSGVQVERLARSFAGAGGTVRATDAEGRWIERGAQLAGNGAASELLALSGAEGNLAERRAAAARDWSADPVALDLGALLALAPEGRRDFLLAAAGVGTRAPVAEVLAEIEAGVARALGGPGAAPAMLSDPPAELGARERAAASAWGEPGGLRERLAARLAPATACDPAEALAALLEETCGVKRTAAREAKQASAAAEELGREEAALREAAGAAAGLAERLAEAEETVRGAARRQGQATAAAREADAARRGAVEAERERSRLAVEFEAAKVAPAGGGEEDVARAEEEARRSAAAAEKAETEAAAACAAERDARTATVAAAAAMDSAGNEHVRAVQALDRAYQAHQAAIEAAERARTDLACLTASAEGRLAEAMARARGVAGHAGEALAGPLAALLAAAEAVLGDFEGRRSRLAAEAAAEAPAAPDEATERASHERLVRAGEALGTAEHVEQAAREAAVPTRGARDAARKAAEACARALGEARRRHLAAGAEALARAARVASAGTLMGAAEQVALNAAAEAENLARRAEVLAAGAREGVAVAERERAELAEALAKARRTEGALAALRGARADAQARQALAWMADAAEDAIRDARRARLDGAVRPLLADAGRFLAAAGLPHVPEIRLETAKGRATCELGWVPAGGGALVPVEALSGGEAVLFGAALSAALLGRLPGRKALLLEADPCDAENLARLLRGLAAVVPPEATVLVATARPLTGAPAGWTIREWTGDGWQDRPGRE